jgi:hypothetical protein
LATISGKTKNIWWFDVRTGKALRGKASRGSGVQTFTPPRQEKDWVLVIDNASKKFGAPGKEK